MTSRVWKYVNNSKHPSNMFKLPFATVLCWELYIENALFVNWQYTNYEWRIADHRDDKIIVLCHIRPFMEHF